MKEAVCILKMLWWWLLLLDSVLGLFSARPDLSRLVIESIFGVLKGTGRSGTACELVIGETDDMILQKSLACVGFPFFLRIAG